VTEPLSSAAHHVSVAITTYNQARFIGATIESVLAQTCPPDEIVVVDDGSQDGTAEVVGQFGDRVRLVRQRNGGVTRARNRAVRECRGDFVALLDGDDLWLPTKLERCLAALRLTPEAEVIAHDIETVSEDARQVLERGPMTARVAGLTAGDPPLFRDCWQDLVADNPIWTTSQVMMRRDTFLAAGMSNPRFGNGSDYDLYLRLAGRLKFLLVPEVLTQWRQHDRSASGAGYERRLATWRADAAAVLGTHARREGPARAAALRKAEAAALRLLVRDVYLREQTDGRLATGRVLWQVARRCRSGLAAWTLLAVLTPSSLRRLGAMASRTRPW